LFSVQEQINRNKYKEVRDMKNWIDDILETWKLVAEAIQYEQDGSGEGLRCKIVEFIADNLNPLDDQIHKFAGDQGIDPVKLEEVIYGMLSEIIEKGKGGTPDPNELAMGIKVEFEHTSCPKLSEYIARTHLKELPDYYTLLKKMEAK
jgi:hypothetical protein